MRFEWWFLFLFFVTPAVAVKQPSCSFGSTPMRTFVESFPGGEIVIPWSMYNYYGNLPTYVNITIENFGWDVSVNIPGKDEIVLQPNHSDSGRFITHPLTGDPVPAEDVYVTIRVPANETIGSRKNIVLIANAFCPLKEGTIIPGIQTQLDVEIQVVERSVYYSKFSSNQCFFPCPIYRSVF